VPDSIARLSWPDAVYVHVPFCRHRCGYCDFTLIANRRQLIPEWLELLAREFAQECADVPAPLPVNTIFLGGGTPTHLNSHELRQLFGLIGRYFTLSSGGEFSVEANPEDLNDECLETLAEAGVNRISLGVQSFDSEVLKTLERSHSPDMASEAVIRAAGAIPNTSLDLIFGVPGQSLESWMQTLQIATSLPVRHISTYGLTFEQGTAFFRRERTGQIHRAPEELEKHMYLAAISHLQDSGFAHYEVSNFARPGAACRHNMVYWQAREYFAFGPGAARYLHGVRTTNCRSVVRWMNAWKQGQPCHEDCEQLSAEEKAREAILLALRLRSGLQIAEFERRFDCSLKTLAGDVLDQQLQSQMVEIVDGALRLTPRGLLLTDSVVAEYL
jgi:oxygen-independent coproporphyrinogen-3 oxidase